MDIILHLGTHRTGSTTFQAYMRENADALAAADVAFWGPRRTRNGLFSGVLPNDSPAQGRLSPQVRAKGRVQLRLRQLRDKGTHALLVSDENFAGSVRGSIRAASLYPGIGERIARYAAVFDGKITRVALSIRAQDRWWASALAYGVGRGLSVPGPQKFAMIAESARSWRDVIMDLAAALPGTEIRVMPYEAYYANPNTLMRASIGLEIPLQGEVEWLNRAPDLPSLRKMLQERDQDPSILPEEDGMWDPFSKAQSARLREMFDEDMFWLVQGADGLATLTEEAIPRDRGKSPGAALTRGHDNDEEGCLDETG